MNSKIELKEKLLGLSGFVIDNEYLDLYCCLITNNINLKQQKGRTQKHHIIPQHYFRYVGEAVDNSEQNLVNLYYKDHVLCHYYLSLCSIGVFKYYNSESFKYCLNNSNYKKLSNYEDDKSFLVSLDKIQELYEEIQSYKSDCCFINNNGIVKMVRKDDLENHLLQGWLKGNGKKGKPSPLKGKPGKKQSDETRQKISNSHKDKKLSNETKEKISKANKDKKRTLETKQKIGEASKGRKHSEEARNKNRLAHLGKHHDVSEETRKKLSVSTKRRFENQPGTRKGVKLSEETKYKMSCSAKKANQAKRVKVVCLETLQLFESVLAAEKFCGGCVSNVLKGRSKTAGGYHWAKLENLELTIIGYEEGTNSLKGALGAFIVDYKDNKVKVGSGFTKDFRKEAWTHIEDYIGLTLEVQYFEETCNAQGGISLRFPVARGLRFDK